MGHSIEAGTLFHIADFPFTNTMLAALLTTLTILLIAVAFRVKVSTVPGTLQSIIEMLYEYLEGIAQNVAGKKRAQKFLPWIFSFFLFIIISNYWGLTPIFGEGIVVEEKQEAHVEEQNHNENEDKNAEHSNDNKIEEVHNEKAHSEFPLLRGATSDTNMTFGLSAISFVLIMGYGLILQGPVGLFKHYFKTKPLGLIPVYIFVGVLELFLEPLKAISLSFRLFGNILAGEMLVASMTIVNGTALPFVAVPFLLLEVLVGFIQAFVFALLTLVFMSVITSKH